MSLAEWTATSIRRASSASSISLTKTPREPISPKGFVRSLSPAVVIGTSAISTPSALRRSAASSACVSARRLPRLPIRISIARPFQPEQVPDGVGVRRAVGPGGRLLQTDGRVVQQLVDDLHSERLDGAALLRSKVGQPAAGAAQLPKSNLLGVPPQRSDRRDHAARCLPGAEAFRLLGHDRLGPGRGTLDGPGADGLVQVVDVVEKRVGQRGDLGIEIAGDGEVDQQQRPALACSKRALDVLSRDKEAPRVRRRYDDVRVAESGCNRVECERLRVESPGYACAAFLAAIRDERDPGSACDQPGGGGLADLARTDQQHLAVAQVAEHALGEHGRGRGGRGCGIPDRRLRAHLATDAQRLTEEPIEQWTRRPERIRGANLTKNLGLAAHARVEPGRDPEEVAGRLVVAAPVQGSLDIAESAGRALRRARAGDVELGSITGRKAHRFALVACELAGELSRLVRVEGGALAHFERRPVVRDADERELSQPAPPHAARPRLPVVPELSRSSRSRESMRFPASSTWNSVAASARIAASETQKVRNIEPDI